MLAAHDGLYFARFWINARQEYGLGPVLGWHYLRTRDLWISAGCPKPIRIENYTRAGTPDLFSFLPSSWN